MTWRIQLLRYGIVGVASNVALYLIYLLLTTMGIVPTLAMTIAYAMGVVQTFYFNKRWTFVSREADPSAFMRYVMTYAIGYVVNIFLLWFFVDYWRWPHQWVQAGAILLIAAILFILQRHWVFRGERPA